MVLDFAGTAPREVALMGVVPETLEGGMRLSPRVAGWWRAGDAVWREELGYRHARVKGAVRQLQPRNESRALKQHVRNALTGFSSCDVVR